MTSVSMMGYRLGFCSQEHGFCACDLPFIPRNGTLLANKNRVVCAWYMRLTGVRGSDLPWKIVSHCV